jgi:hypothetical protein
MSTYSGVQGVNTDEPIARAPLPVAGADPRAVAFSRSLSATFMPTFRCRDGAGEMSGESFTKLYWLRDRAVRQTVRRLKPRAGNGERYRINEYGLG